MNQAYIVGRLTRAPEVRTTPSGVSVTTFTVAVNRQQNKEETDFLNVVTWRGLADNCGKYLVQGQRVAVVGEIRTRNYEDKNGVKRFVTEIHAEDVEFLDKPAQPAQTAASTSPYGQTYNQASIFDEAPESQVYDDEDLPF